MRWQFYKSDLSIIAVPVSGTFKRMCLDNSVHTEEDDIMISSIFNSMK